MQFTDEVKEQQICDLLSFLGSVIYDAKYFGERCGIEIGGPSDIFKSVYPLCKSCDGVNFSEDTVWWKKDENRYEYKGQMLGQVYIADATDLSAIADNQYDFVLSSNNVEHIANPLKALKEFGRILKRDGVIVIAVPVKERTFDHNKPDTTFKHLCEDYDNNIREDDLSHLAEILELHDYSMDILCGGKAAFQKRAEKNIQNRCLHHHVFSEACLREMYEWLGLEVIDFWKVAENYIILGKKK